jgi:hypothetical protein
MARFHSQYGLAYELLPILLNSWVFDPLRIKYNKLCPYDD